MDIVKAFKYASSTIHVNIQGTHEDPLFQANQIGKLLGLTNVRKSMEGFDEDERVVSTSYTPAGGHQQTLFLTELGLYRLLGQSRKPQARPFQKWVAQIVREIRLNGKYELQTENERLRIVQEEANAEKQRILLEAAARELQLQQEAAEARALAAAKEEELQKLKGKTYEEVPKHDDVYICKEAAELHSERHKIGMTTTKVKSREQQFNTGSAQGCKMIFTRKTSNAKIVEGMTHFILRRYNFSREHFQCRVDHSINVIDFACTVVDTLASSYECITREELGQKLIGNLMNEFSPQPDGDGGMSLFSQFVGGQEGPIDDNGTTDTPNATNKLHEFLAMNEDERVTHEDRAMGRAGTCYRIGHVPGCVTWLEDFRAAYRDVMNADAPKELDPAVLRSFGFTMDAKRVNVCKSCKQLASGRNGKCCAEYNHDKRIMKVVIQGMELQQVL